MSHFTGPVLPDHAVPRAYDLRVDLDVAAGTFTGTVAVNVDLLREDRFIVVNGIDIAVDKEASSFTPCESSEVVLKGGDLSLNCSTITSSSKLSKFRVVAIKCYEQKIVLEFDSYLPRGEGVLDLVFSGKTTKGLFISHGENEKNSARRLFPCWDEPVYKARFKITLQVPLEFVAVTNMPIMEENVEGNRKIVSYHESPNMPTYLVTIVVGLLEPSTNSEFLRLFKSREATSQVLEQTEILDDDIVMNIETKRVSRVGFEDEKLFLFPIDKEGKEELRRDELVVVSRPFFHGEPVCLVRDRKKLGVICGVDIKVDLASSDGKTIAHHDIGTESLERNRRFVVSEPVVHGSWFGLVRDVELDVGVRPAGKRRTFTTPYADPESLEPIFKNGAEAYVNQPYYVGQEVIDLSDDDKPIRGVVTKHKVDRLIVDWTHCSSLREEKKPLESIFYREVERMHNPRFSRAFWTLGSRCIFEGKELLIAGIRAMVKVKWQEGFVEEISSTELLETKEFFSGQFVTKKEDKGVEGCVRMVVDGLAWVKWFEGEHCEVLHSSELQPHLDYQFQISDVVAEKSGSRGFIVGMGNGKVEVEWWPNKTITEVKPEEITRLLYYFGEDLSQEDVDVEGPSFHPGPIASSGSVLLGPASSSDEDEDDM